MMHIYYRGVRVELEIVDMRRGVSEDGSPVMFVDLEAVVPPGPPGPGEPVELPRAA